MNRRELVGCLICSGLYFDFSLAERLELVRKLGRQASSCRWRRSAGPKAEGSPRNR